MIIKPKVKCIAATPLKVIDTAIGMCWNKQRGKDVIDRERMYRVGNKHKHGSTLEHVYFSFIITDFSRAGLQELVRTRIASFGVKSSRYTLKGDLLAEKDFVTIRKDDVKTNDGQTLIERCGLEVTVDNMTRASKYIVLTGDKQVDSTSVIELQMLKDNITDNKSNDITKYNLPEAYKTELVFTINMRSIQNFLNLRTSTAALKELQLLGHAIYDAIPVEYRFMLSDFIYDSGRYDSEYTELLPGNKLEVKESKNIYVVLDIIEIERTTLFKCIEVDATKDTDKREVRFLTIEHIKSDYRKLKDSE